MSELLKRLQDAADVYEEVAFTISRNGEITMEVKECVESANLCYENLIELVAGQVSAYIDISTVKKVDEKNYVAIDPCGDTLKIRFW